MSEVPTFRSFCQLLETLEDGQLHNDLTEMLETANDTLKEYVDEHGGKHEAHISIKLKFKTVKGVVTVTPEIDAKLPKKPRTDGQLYLTDDGFSPENPKQLKLFGKPKVLESGTSEARTI